MFQSATYNRSPLARSPWNNRCIVSSLSTGRSVFESVLFFYRQSRCDRTTNRFLLQDRRERITRKPGRLKALRVRGRPTAQRRLAMIIIQPKKLGTSHNHQAIPIKTPVKWGQRTNQLSTRFSHVLRFRIAQARATVKINAAKKCPYRDFIGRS